MNDRYLYKAKRIDNGEWVEGYILYNENKKGYEICIYQKIVNANEYLYRSFEVDPSTVCQCTGLRDKNGKLIWENDIVRCGKICTVTWCDTFASWRLNTTGWMYSHFFGEACKPEDVEVIGNIFDNPELLEVGE